VRGKSKERRVNFVTKIDELTFGSIIVEDKNYRQYVLLLVNGTMKK